MRTAIEKSEVEVDGEKVTYWDVACGECPGGFLSEGWPTKKLAMERRDQHVKEHETGEPAPPKAELLTEPAQDRAARNIAQALASRRRG